MQLSKAVFFIREFDPEDNIPDPYPGTRQWDKLRDYCGDNKLIPVGMPHHCMIMEPKEYSLPLGEQGKVKDLLAWLAENPGCVLLTCSLAHISADDKEIEWFRKELTNRQAELISLNPREGKLKPLGLTDRHREIMQRYFPSLEKIFALLKRQRFREDLRNTVLEKLKKDKQLYPILKEKLEDETFYRFGAKGEPPGKKPDRFFWKEVYGVIFKGEGLPPVGNSEIYKGVNQIRRPADQSDIRS
jgi:hypothetical protein